MGRFNSESALSFLSTKNRKRKNFVHIKRSKRAIIRHPEARRNAELLLLALRQVQKDS